jgi:hypothetical protein
MALAQHGRLPKERIKSQRVVWMAAMAIGTCAITFLIVGPTRRAIWKPSTAPATDGRLAVTTEPPGVAVVIDGTDSGTTPVTLSVSPGAHQMVLRHGSEQKTVPLTMNAGDHVSQYFELAAPAARPTTGKLDSAVTAVSRPTTPVRSKAPAGDGWMKVVAPFELQISERDEPVGSSAAARITMSVGRHDLRLTNAPLGFEATRSIDIASGKSQTIRVTAPLAEVSINANPWADVFVDDTLQGQTPLGKLSLPVGTHQVTFRHPELGERRQTTLVTVRGPNRISADLSR